MLFDPIYWLFALPGILLGVWASFLTKTTFNKYSKVGSQSRLTGASAARRLLDVNGLQDVKVERVAGFLSDHYDPNAVTLRLSPPVYDSPSLAAIGVACHEAGHALQHADSYAPLTMRSALVPVTQFSSSLWMPIFILGLFMHIPMLMKAAVFLFAMVVVFSLVTLPVEWNATARAKRQMVSAGIVSADEQVAAGKVLNAAFLTYVAGAVSAILTLLYYMLVARGRN